MESNINDDGPRDRTESNIGGRGNSRDGWNNHRKETEIHKTDRGRANHVHNRDNINPNHHNIADHNNKVDQSENDHQQQQKQKQKQMQKKMQKQKQKQKQQQKQPHEQRQRQHQHQQQQHQKYVPDKNKKKIKSEQGKHISLSKNDNNSGRSSNTTHISTQKSGINSKGGKDTHNRNKLSNGGKNGDNGNVTTKSKKQKIKKRNATSSSAKNGNNSGRSSNTTHISKQKSGINSKGGKDTHNRNKLSNGGKNGDNGNITAKSKKQKVKKRNAPSSLASNKAVPQNKRSNNKRVGKSRHCQNGWLIPILGIFFVLPNRKHEKKIKVSQSYKRNIRIKRHPATSGYLAAKAKVAGKQKAVRKEKNLSRLVRKHNSTTIITYHAAQRYQERGPSTYPIYEYRKDRVKGGGSEEKAIVITFIPMKNYEGAKQARDTVIGEVKKNHQYSKRSQLPKKILSWREAAVLREGKRRAKKVDTNRKRKQREIAYERAGCQQFDCDFFIRPTKRAIRFKESKPVKRIRLIKKKKQAGPTQSVRRLRNIPVGQFKKKQKKKNNQREQKRKNPKMKKTKTNLKNNFKLNVLS